MTDEARLDGWLKSSQRIPHGLWALDFHLECISHRMRPASGAQNG